MQELEREVGSLIIEALDLKDVAVADFKPLAPLFDGGLGLDSIDALEISLAISARYGIQISANDSNIEEIFSSLRALSEFIQTNRRR